MFSTRDNFERQSLMLIQPHWKAIPTRVVGTAAVLLATMLITGCGTTMNVKDFYVSPPPPGQSSIKQDGHIEASKLIYGGVYMDAIFGTEMLLSESQNDLRAGPIGLYTLAVDLPLSFIGDTITLPVTIPATLKRLKTATESSRTTSSELEVRTAELDELDQKQGAFPAKR